MSYKKFWGIKYACAVALVTGCAQVAPQLDKTTFYKRDVGIKVNGLSAEGVIVVPRADKYEFEITAKSSLDLFSISSCHREQTVENAGEGGIFGDKKKVKLTYYPIKNLEDVNDCPLEIGGFSVNGRHSWGFVDFQTDTWIPAKTKCDGKSVDTVGVSVCQSKVGLIEQLVFKSPVRVAHQTNPACPQLESKDGLTWEYRMPLKQCVYVFSDSSNSLHRHTSIGYESILIRNN